ncbi:MAG: DUF6049 family protein [Kofleriaceae bacterium]
MKARSIFLRHRIIASVTLLSLVTSSCGGRTSPSKVPSGSSPLADSVLVQQKDLPPGLDLRVSDGKAGAPAFDRATLAPTTKLSDADATQLLSRTKAITADTQDKQAFALRPKSLPAPRTGNVIKASFPAPPSSLLPPKSNDAGKDLTVLRYMPEGEVPLAPELSVTFSQPMVAVTSQDDAAATTPVKLVPQPKGRWRWIGTRTILFDPEVRFPQATTYRVEVGKGTKSTAGGVLKETKSFTFTTPPPGMVGSYPHNHEPQHLDVPMFVAFDQKIDQLAVVDKIHVTANGSSVPIRLLRPEDIAKDKTLDALVKSTIANEQDGRWLAFRATRPFPKDAQIDVKIGVGTPSAEGPNRTEKEQSFSFRTYPPLAIERAECGWGECYPGSPFNIQFNNPLDADKWDDVQLTISPPIPSVKIVQSGRHLSVAGLTKARTTYKVVVSGGILDEFGQTLGNDATLDFRVGDAQPTFFGPNGMVVLDPAAKKPTLDFFSTNYPQMKVKLYSVTPGDYDAYAFYMRNLWNRDKPPRMPGKLVKDGLVKTTPGSNDLVETSLDLSPALVAKGLGHAIAVVEPHPWPHDWEPPRLISWVQSTRIAVDAYVDAGNLVAYASDLATGKAAAGVALELEPNGIQATTDDKGMATIALPQTANKGKHYLTAKRGDDVVFVTDDTGYWSEGGHWVKQTRSTNLAWYVIDDRKMYKPGEEVTLKGWLRTIDANKGGDVAGIGSAVSSVSYTVVDQTNNKIGQGTAQVSAVGGFDTKFTLPKTPNLGYATVRFEAKGRTSGSYHHGFQIQEFRRPEFEVKANASQGPFLVGGSGDVTVDAKYYAGGPLAGAQTNWYVTSSQASYTPPNRDDFIFGTWTPWWGYRGWSEDEGGYQAPKTWEHSAKTDATGAHTLHFDFLSVNPPRTMSVVANASVTDVNRQTWSAAATMLVHPSDRYVGLKTKKPFVEKGVPFPLEVIGVDLDGNASVGSKIEVKAVRLDWSYKKGKFTIEEVDAQSCSVVAAKDPVPCEFATPEGGSYQVTATIVDAKGRPNQTSMTFWVTGGDTPPAREVKQERVELIPDKKEYKHGDTAELLVMAPFYPAEAIISWRRSGLVKTERVTMTGPTTTVKVPITDALVPNMFVQVDLVGAAARTDDKGDPDPNLPKRPAYAVGNINLPIPPKQRTLYVKVSSSVGKLAPGETAKLTVDVKDAFGKPVANSETAVLVVDESILALSGYQFPNPIDVFYGVRGPDVRDYYLRESVKLAKPDASVLAEQQQQRPAAGMAAPESAAAPTTPPPAPPPPPPGGAKDKAKKEANRMEDEEDGGQQPANTAIAVRSNFNPLAAFSPTVKTDANGRATVEIKMPDNLTRYRIVAVTTAGEKQFGKGESAIVARLPLMVRPSPPRFLNFGDTFKLPVVVQNQTDAPMKVRVAIRATNAQITDGAGREVSVPANDRALVLFPAAAEMAGTARFQIVGATGNYSDAAELALPVWTPATTEGFATYGVIDNGAIKQQVALPGKVVTQFGGLEVTTASTNLQALTDAFLYLVQYPYECAEQRASRVLAIASLRDVLTAFKTKDMPAPAALEASVKTDIERLSQMQNYDGGFAFWQRGYPSNPYLSVYVTNALQHAKAKGFAVPQSMIDRAKPYLKNIENYYPWYYSKEVRWSISAYALYTRKQIGDLDIAKGKKLYAEASATQPKTTATMETHGWLLGLFAQHKDAVDERKALVKHALNRTSETAGAANFVASYGDSAYLLLASNHRVDAVMLESLIQEQTSGGSAPDPPGNYAI